jgi:hypothetical protein
LTNSLGVVTSVLTILQTQPTTVTTTQTAVEAGAPAAAATAGPAQQIDTNVLVTNVVQTTVIDSTPVVVTSQVSLPLLPAITSGAATLTLNSMTYTVSVDGGTTIVNGKTAVLSTNVDGQTLQETVVDGKTMGETVVDGKTMGETVVDGKTMAVYATVVGGNTFLVSSVIQGASSTIFGMSSITKSASGSSSTGTDGAGPSASGKGSGLGVGAGIGIGVGCTVLLTLLGALLLYMTRRWRNQQLPEEQEMSGIVGATGDEEDGTSTIATSEDSTSAKFELDGIERQPPVELPGDMLRPQEIDGREAELLMVSPVDRKNTNSLEEVSPVDFKNSHSPEEVSPVDVKNSHSPETLSVDRRDALSTVVSPIARSNSEREIQWPLVSSASDVT